MSLTISFARPTLGTVLFGPICAGRYAFLFSSQLPLRRSLLKRYLAGLCFLGVCTITNCSPVQWVDKLVTALTDFLYQSMSEGGIVTT